MRRPRILLDVDGPLTAGFFELACAMLQEHGIEHAHPSLIDRWDIFEAFNTPPEVAQNVRDALRDEGWALSFDPRPGAAEAVRDLQVWADVYAVTSPLDGSPTWAYEREKWLAEKLGIAPDRVVSVRDKRVVGGDALVDDKVEHLVEWKAEYPDGLAVLWREPHNNNATWNGPKAGRHAELLHWLETLRRWVS